MRHAILTFAALAASLLTSCHTLVCQEPEPTPAPTACVSGTVVGETCLDGILIQLDEQYPIGGPAAGYSNVVAAVNFNDFGSLNVPGQRVYFNYTITNAGAPRFCTANQVPIFSLNSGKLLQVSNLSATACR